MIATKEFIFHIASREVAEGTGDVAISAAGAMTHVFGLALRRGRIELNLGFLSGPRSSLLIFIIALQSFGPERRTLFCRDNQEGRPSYAERQWQSSGCESAIAETRARRERE